MTIQNYPVVFDRNKVLVDGDMGVQCDRTPLDSDNDWNQQQNSRAIVVDMNESDEIKKMLKKTVDYNKERKAVNMSAMTVDPR